MKKGLLVVISGFSGAGKGTIIRQLLDKYEHYALSVSATTRSPREHEKDGVDYFFVTRERFEEMIAHSELIEYASYVGNYYGTPARYVEDRLAEGTDVILEIETKGAADIRTKYPDSVLIFVTPPNAEILARRLLDRGTESRETAMKRLAKAYTECDSMAGYDYIVINDDLGTAVDTVNSIIESSRLRASHSAEIIDRMREGLSKYSN